MIRSTALWKVLFITDQKHQDE